MDTKNGGSTECLWPGNKVSIDLPSEDRGNIPDTAAYNKEYRTFGTLAPILP